MIPKVLKNISIKSIYCDISEIKLIHERFQNQNQSLKCCHIYAQCLQKCQIFQYIYVRALFIFESQYKCVLLYMLLVFVVVNVSLADTSKKIRNSVGIRLIRKTPTFISKFLQSSTNSNKNYEERILDILHHRNCCNCDK